MVPSDNLNPNPTNGGLSNRNGHLHGPTHAHSPDPQVCSSLWPQSERGCHSVPGCWRLGQPEKDPPVQQNYVTLAQNLTPTLSCHLRGGTRRQRHNSGSCNRPAHRMREERMLKEQHSYYITSHRLSHLGATLASLNCLLTFNVILFQSIRNEIRHTSHHVNR